MMNIRRTRSQLVEKVTVCVSSGEAGMDSAQESKKLEARKMHEMRLNSHRPLPALLGGDFIQLANVNIRHLRFVTVASVAQSGQSKHTEQPILLDDTLPRRESTQHWVKAIRGADK